MSTPPRRIPREFEREMVKTETLVVEARPTGGRAISAVSRNLSLSGIFVESTEKFSLGDEVQLFIGNVSSASALRVVARVVHVVDGVGFGAHFTDDTPEGRETVGRFLTRFRARGGGPR
jgi:hypothetical protein